MLKILRESEKTELAFQAIQHDYAWVLRLLLDLGLNPDKEFRTAEYPYRLLSHAVRSGNSHAVRRTTLMHAVQSGHPEIVQLLLDSLKFIRPSTPSASSPVGISGSSGDFQDPQSVKNFLAIRDQNDRTALMIAHKQIEGASWEKRHNYIHIFNMLQTYQLDLEIRLQQ